MEQKNPLCTKRNKILRNNKKNNLLNFLDTYKFKIQ